MKSIALGVMVLLALGCRNENKGQSTSAPAKAPSESVSTAPSANASAAALDANGIAMAEMLVATDCLPCHDNLMLEQQRLTSKQWAAVVKKMQSWGSQIPPENVDMVVAYLSQRYTPDTAEFDVPRVSVEDVAARFSASPDGAFGGGDPRRGETLFKQVCATCHGADAQGAAIGVALVDRHILQRPADFANMVRKGRGRMPGLPSYQDADIAAMLAYLRERKR